MINAVTNSVGDDIALELVKRGLPTTIGIRGDLTYGGDVIVGGDVGLDHTVAWNWYSDEIGLIEGKSLGTSIGTPQLVGVNGSIGFMLGHGGTELDSFGGSSTTFSGSVQVDEFVKAGFNGSVALGTDKLGNLSYDPQSQIPVFSEYGGISAGINIFANQAEARAGVSPGTNHSRVVNSAEDLWKFVDDLTSFRYFKSFTSE